MVSCTETQLVAHTVKQIASLNNNGIYGARTRGHYKIGKPYKIRGKRFYPREQWAYEEVGLASWYGLQDHGKPTANGEIFNQYELVAAHRTLQLPSIVEVTNLENGRKIIVRVCDRGPFAKEHHRILDVSMRAAELLGFKKKGTVRVRVKLLKEESARAAAAMKQGYRHMGGRGSYEENFSDKVEKEQQFEPLEIKTLPSEDYQFKPLTDNTLNKGSHYVQLGAFQEFDRAQTLGVAFKKYGDIAIESSDFVSEQAPLFKVKIGPFHSREEAEKLLLKIKTEWQDAILTH